MIKQNNDDIHYNNKNFIKEKIIKEILNDHFAVKKISIFNLENFKCHSIKIRQKLQNHIFFLISREDVK